MPLPKRAKQTDAQFLQSLRQTIERAEGPGESNLSVSTGGTIYGCCGLFDLCGDQDLMSLSLEGTNKFLDWIGWEMTDVCRIRKNFVAWVAPAQTESGYTAGYISDPCADAEAVDWGVCDFTLEDFGRLRRKTPVRDITKVGVRLCEAQPRYRLDGSPITDDLEYDMRIVSEGIVQDMKRYIISGAKTTAGLFDGFQALINTGYKNSDGHLCQLMDSIVIDWNANTLNGGAGMTWNSAAIGSSYNFIDVLMAAYRRVRQRISWAPALAAMDMKPGDMVIVGTTNFIQCLLDAFTCWSVCPQVGSLIDLQAALMTLDVHEARQFRDALNGGMFGAGQITLDGFTIPCVAYDWGLTTGTLDDVYLLTGQVGNVKLLQGQLNDMRPAATHEATGGKYAYTDGGRFLTWSEFDGTCLQRYVEQQPRLLAWAPWCQVRFEDVKCTRPGGRISPDPTSSFFPETSFRGTICPPELGQANSGPLLG